MPNRPEDNAEYVALQNSIAAEKRYRMFRYIWTILLGVAFFAFAAWLSHDAQIKAAKVVENTAKRQGQTQDTIAREQIRYTTCLLVIKDELRTPEVQQRCFKAADLPGGLNRSDFSPVVVPPTDRDVTATVLTQGQGSSASSGGGVKSSSPSQSNPSPASPQSNNSQPVDNDGVIVDLPLLPPVHIPSPF